jgi:hypothetical protein
MASMAELRERQRISVALYKGEPVLADDYDTVRQVLVQVRWYRPLALFFGILCLAWLYFPLFGHGSLRWTGILWVFATGVMTWSLLRRRKRIIAGATNMGRRQAD